MAATMRPPLEVTLLHNSVSRCLTPKLIKPISIHKFLARKSTFGTCGSMSITELVKTSAFRTSSSGNNTRCVEELVEVKAFVNESTEFSPQVMIVDGGFDFEASLIRMSKLIVALPFVITILSMHDVEALWAATGSVVNALLSFALKRILNQERPVSSKEYGPGMPSSHAQSSFFTTVFVITSNMKSLGLNSFTIIVSTLVLVFSSYLSWLRVSQQRHTVAQVVVGAGVGSLFSIFWFWSWNVFMLDAFILLLPVRMIVVSAAAGFCLGFILHVISCWTSDGQ